MDPEPSIGESNTGSIYPACFPDTLCLKAAWSPVYPGFDIQEGMIYAGTSRFDLSLKSQYHRLMSNHQVSLGFPILSDDRIKAGLQIHYTLSALHGEETQHKGSCSGALIIRPQTTWQVSLSSMHIISYPRDSTEHILSPSFSAGISYSIFKGFATQIYFKKSTNLKWRSFLSIRWDIVQDLSLTLAYEIGEGNLAFTVCVAIGRVDTQGSFALHSYLGFTQGYAIKYEY